MNKSVENNPHQDYINNMSNYVNCIRQFFWLYQKELLFCIRQQVDPDLIDEFLLSSLAYSDYWFELEHLFMVDGVSWMCPYIQAIKLLKGVTDASLLTDEVIKSNADCYKQSSVFAMHLNEVRDKEESGYIERRITINGAMYSLYYRRATSWVLSYWIEDGFHQYCLNDYQYIQLVKKIVKNEQANIELRDCGNLFSLDKKNTHESAQKWIYNLLWRRFEKQENQEIIQILGTHWPVAD